MLLVVSALGFSGVMSFVVCFLFVYFGSVVVFLVFVCFVLCFCLLCFV